MATIEQRRREVDGETDNGSGGSHIRRVLSQRDFRLLFVGTATSLLGDQFALIATPWLVLQLTGDPLALGIVLALEGIPRAAFMLIGGAVTDRFASRRVMLVSDVIRLGLTTLMATAVLAGVVEMWMVYGFALGFGLVAGFAVPAENSMVPMLVKEEDLQAGNSLIMGVTQIAGFVGPSLAGAAIAMFSDSARGVGLAFSIDAATFAVSTVCLWLIRGARRPAGDAGETGLWTSIGNGIRYLMADTGLRIIFGVLVVINFLVVGPLLVGIPVLAHDRLPQGATAFGLLMGAFSVGNLIGYVLAGSLERPSGRAIRMVMIGLMVGFGGVIGSLGLISHLWLDFGLLAMLGLGNGYLAIILFTWIQTHVDRGMLGRMMSLITFASIGLISVSQTISGAVAKWDINILFLTSGALALLATAWIAFQPGLRVLSNNLAGVKAADEAQ